MNTCWSSRSPKGPRNKKREKKMQFLREKLVKKTDFRNRLSPKHGRRKFGWWDSHSPMPLPAKELGWASCDSRETTLKDARGVEPGCVEIMPRKRVTFHERTWLYSEQMETRFFSLSMTFITGFRCTMNVWKSCGPWPTVSGCWTITRTVPELVPYAISIQLPLKPDTQMIWSKDFQLVTTILS